MVVGPKLLEKSEELSICASLGGKGDEIELTGPIKSNSGQTYDFWNMIDPTYEKIYLFIGLYKFTWLKNNQTLIH